MLESLFWKLENSGRFGLCISGALKLGSQFHLSRAGRFLNLSASFSSPVGWDDNSPYVIGSTGQLWATVCKDLTWSLDDKNASQSLLAVDIGKMHPGMSVFLFLSLHITSESAVLICECITMQVRSAWHRELTRLLEPGNASISVPTYQIFEKESSPTWPSGLRESHQRQDLQDSKPGWGAGDSWEGWLGRLYRFSMNEKWYDLLRVQFIYQFPTDINTQSYFI